MRVDAHNVQYFDVDYDNIRVNELPDEAQSIIERINRKIAAKASLDELMNFLFEATEAIYSGDRISLAFVEEDGRRVISRWCRTNYEPVMLGVGYTEDMVESSLREVIEKRKVRLIHNLIQYVFMYPESKASQLLLEEGVRSSMTCPLVVEGKTIGLLFRNSRQANAFDARHVLQHLAIAERLSQAIELTYRLDELAQVNSNYIELLSFFSHELKSPLSSIIMDSNLLVEGYLGDLQPKQKDKLQGIHIKADYLLNLVRDYLDLARIEGGDLRLNAATNVDLVQDIINPAISLVEVQLDNRGMELILPPAEEPMLIEVDPTLMKIALNNLLSNAVKYGRRHGEVRLRYRLENGRLMISVYNEGLGWAKSQQANLFRKFSRLDTSETRKESGTGVGLYATWRIIQLHGGLIKATSQHGQWARFVIEVPQPLKPANDPVQQQGASR